jgi:hypothetical protein
MTGAATAQGDQMILRGSNDYGYVMDLLVMFRLLCSAQTMR